MQNVSPKDVIKMLLDLSLSSRHTHGRMEVEV
jgi:hypothetical protein